MSQDTLDLLGLDDEQLKNINRDVLVRYIRGLERKVEKIDTLSDRVKALERERYRLQQYPTIPELESQMVAATPESPTVERASFARPAPPPTAPKPIVKFAENKVTDSEVTNVQESDQPSIEPGKETTEPSLQGGEIQSESADLPEADAVIAGGVITVWQDTTDEYIESSNIVKELITDTGEEIESTNIEKELITDTTEEMESHNVGKELTTEAEQQIESTNTEIELITDTEEQIESPNVEKELTPETEEQIESTSTDTTVITDTKEHIEPSDLENDLEINAEQNIEISSNEREDLTENDLENESNMETNDLPESVESNVADIHDKPGDDVVIDNETDESESIISTGEETSIVTIETTAKIEETVETITVEVVSTSSEEISKSSAEDINDESVIVADREKDDVCETKDVELDVQKDDLVTDIENTDSDKDRSENVEVKVVDSLKDEENLTEADEIVESSSLDDKNVSITDAEERTLEIKIDKSDSLPEIDIRNENNIDSSNQVESNIPETPPTYLRDLTKTTIQDSLGSSITSIESLEKEDVTAGVDIEVAHVATIEKSSTLIEDSSENEAVSELRDSQMEEQKEILESSIDMKKEDSSEAAENIAVEDITGPTKKEEIENNAEITENAVETTENGPVISTNEQTDHIVSNESANSQDDEIVEVDSSEKDAVSEIANTDTTIDTNHDVDINGNSGKNRNSYIENKEAAEKIIIAENGNTETITEEPIRGKKSKKIKDDGSTKCRVCSLM